MSMTDQQLLEAALPLLQELVKRDMLIATIDVPAPPHTPDVMYTSARKSIHLCSRQSHWPAC